MTRAEIDARVQRFTDHLDLLLARSQIDVHTYLACLQDTHDWARRKRAEAGFPEAGPNNEENRI